MRELHRACDAKRNSDPDPSREESEQGIGDPIGFWRDSIEGQQKRRQKRDSVDDDHPTGNGSPWHGAKRRRHGRETTGLNGGIAILRNGGRRWRQGLTEETLCDYSSFGFKSWGAGMPLGYRFSNRQPEP